MICIRLAPVSLRHSSSYCVLSFLALMATSRKSPRAIDSTLGFEWGMEPSQLSEMGPFEPMVTTEFTPTVLGLHEQKRQAGLGLCIEP